MRRFPRLRAFAITTLTLASTGVGEAQTRLVVEPIVEDARGKGAEWRFTTEVPSADWMTATFDASAWTAGRGGFGTSTTTGSQVVTDWTASEIHLRQAFTVAEAVYENLVLSVHHDDEVEVYLNGTLIHSEGGALSGYSTHWLGDEAVRALKAGENVLAVRCANSGGGPQYIDVGLSGLRTVRIAPLSPDARDMESEWRYSFDAPAAGWEGTGFDDSAWPLGRAGFGGDQEHIATAWSTSDIWMRRSFESDRDIPGLILTFRNDDDMEVYLNGERVLTRACCANEYAEVLLKEAGGMIRKGTNVLAVHCANSGGGPQFVDVGLVGWEPEAPVTSRKPVARAKARPGVFRYGWIASGRRVDGRSFTAK
jgi:hypothetical protein